jgi:protein-S-isoprenylcysteine O-methyltransferase Ste14
MGNHLARPNTQLRAEIWGGMKIMSLIPAFEVGVWNAWIFMLYHCLGPVVLGGLINKDALKEAVSTAPYREALKKIVIPQQAIYLCAFIYSIFLPLELGKTWFYVGLPICLLASILYAIATVNFATTPFDRSVSKGLYRYSRHPLYVSQSLILIGVGISSASWVFLLFSIVYSIPSFVCAVSEERYCFDKYGDAYREYIEGTPRWIGIPKP